MNRSCSLLIVFFLGTPIGIYRVSTVYLSYIYRVCTVINSGGLAYLRDFSEDHLFLFYIIFSYCSKWFFIYIVKTIYH